LADKQDEMIEDMFTAAQSTHEFGLENFEHIPDFPVKASRRPVVGIFGSMAP
jgi:hypothetical protein